MFYTLILFFVKLWQKTRSVRSLFQFSQCRFYPSCSDYFLESIKIHGLILGTMLSIKRFVRCNPLCDGGVNEVPKEKVWSIAYGVLGGELKTQYARRNMQYSKGSHGH